MIRLICMVCIAAALVGCNDNSLTQSFSEWRLRVWTSVAKGSSFHASVFDNVWANNLLENVKVKAKFRDGLTSQASEKNMDFVYEVSAVLNNPVYKQKKAEEENGEKVIGYKIHYTFSFYDEDGFRIFTLDPSKYVETVHPRHNKKIVFIEGVTASPNNVIYTALIKNIIPENVAKRTARISYFSILGPMKEDVFAECRIEKKQEND